MPDELELSKGKKVIPMKLWMTFIAIFGLAVLQISGSADVLGGLGTLFSKLIGKADALIDAIIKKIG